MPTAVVLTEIERVEDNEEQLSNSVTRVASPVNVVNADAVRTELQALGCPELDVFGPSDGKKFTNKLTSWNFDVPGTPTALIQPKTTADVSAAVKVCNKLGARLVIAGGRHGHDCLATDAIAIDMNAYMKAVEVDTVNKLITVEGGCKLGDMDRASRPHGLACVTGTNPDTGVVGLSTAGGGGYLTRKFGVAVDNFESAEVVLATGEVVQATKTQHADLLWGLAGAGSNFGVVTKLTMRAHPVNMVYGGLVINVAPASGRARAVLTNWRDWIVDAPHSVMSMAVLPCGAPVVPMVAIETDQAVVPQDAKAKCTLKDVPNLKARFSGLQASFGALVAMKQLKRQQYHSEFQPLLEKLQGAGHYYDASCIVPSLSAEVIATLVEFTRVRHPNKLAGLIIFPLGGAVASAPVESTAFWGGGRQKQGFWIIIEGKFKPDPKGINRAKTVAWVKALREALAQYNVSDTAHTLDGNMEQTLAGPQAIFGPNFEKLREIKARYDPQNFFQCNRNITPKDE